jgi:putative MATE family efflux protein
VYREGVSFFRVYCGTFFLQVMLISLSFAFRAVGDFIVPTLISAVSVLLNVALDPLLIFGLGPFPALGVAGAALATVLAQTVGLAGYLWLATASRRNTLLVIRRPFFWDWKIAGRILRIGLPAALQFILFTVSLLITFRYLRPLGGDATAAAAVGFRILQSALLPGVAIGAAVSSLVGQNYGAGQYSRIRSAMRWGLLYVAVVFSAEFALVAANPAFWVSLFAREPSVVAVGAQYLVIMGLTMPVYSIYFIATFSFQGLGRTTAPLAGTAVRLAVVLGGMQVLEHGIGLTAAGVFWVGAAAMVLEAATMGGALLILRRSLLARTDQPPARAAPSEPPGAPGTTPAAKHA